MLAEQVANEQSLAAEERRRGLRPLQSRKNLMDIELKYRAPGSDSLQAWLSTRAGMVLDVVSAFEALSAVVENEHFRRTCIPAGSG